MAVLSKRARDSYMELINQLPLVPIKNEKHLAAATAVVEELLQRKLDAGGEAYLEVLSDLIEDYEDEHHEIEAASPTDILKHLMEAQGISQSQLCSETGLGKSAVSQYVSGVREISKAAAKTLAEYFEIDVALLI